jgi:hypothetical protein
MRRSARATAVWTEPPSSVARSARAVHLASLEDDISDCRRRARAATSISAKGMSSRRHTETMVRTASIPPLAPTPPAAPEAREDPGEVLRWVERAASGRAPRRWWGLRLGFWVWSEALEFGVGAVVEGGDEAESRRGRR